jgi:hypothetical protein
MLMIGIYDYSTIDELVIEAGLGTLIVYLSTRAMSFPLNLIPDCESGHTAVIT